MRAREREGRKGGGGGAAVGMSGGEARGDAGQRDVLEASDRTRGAARQGISQGPALGAPRPREG